MVRRGLRACICNDERRGYKISMRALLVAAKMLLLMGILASTVGVRQPKSFSEVVPQSVQTFRLESPPIEWDRMYGGVKGYCLVQTADGGYAIGGYRSYDFLLIKVNSTGHEQWHRTFGGYYREEVESIVQTIDGGYALAGYTRSFGAGERDVWLVKTDPEGNVQWNKTYEPFTTTYILVQTTDGGYAFVGYTDSEYLILVKTDHDGNMLWKKEYRPNTWAYAYPSVVQTSDGGYALAGSQGVIKNDTYYMADFWLIKTDQCGDAEWNKTYGGLGVDVAYSFIQACDGGYVLAGKTTSFGVSGNDMWLIKTNASGSMQWNITFGYEYNDYVFSVIQTSDGGFALVGSKGTSPEIDSVPWLIKISPEQIRDKSAVIIDPFYSEMGLLRNLLYDVQDSLEYAGCSVSSAQDTSVTVEWLRDGLRHEVVLWRGHSGQFPSGIGLVTGEIVTSENTLKYEDDIENNRTMKIIRGDVGYWAITTEFIEHYYTSNRFPHSLVVVEGCSSLSDPSLASAFVSVDAATYVGYITTVQEPLTSYDMKTLFRNLCEKGYTVKAAVDSVFWGKTILRYYGDPELRVTNLADTTRSIAFVVQSPANLYVTDPEGRDIGFNSTFNQTVIEIPDAIYTGPEDKPQVIWIPYMLNGTYDILLVGTGSGVYDLTVGISSLSEIKTKSEAGTITADQTVIFEANVVGTEIVIIPEFPLLLIPLLFMIATLLVVAVYRKRNSM